MQCFSKSFAAKTRINDSQRQSPCGRLRAGGQACNAVLEWNKITGSRRSIKTRSMLTPTNESSPTKSRRPNNDGKRRGWGGRPVGHAALEWNESPVSTVVSCGFSLWGAKRRWQQGTGLREQYWRRQYFLHETVVNIKIGLYFLIYCILMLLLTIDAGGH